MNYKNWFYIVLAALIIFTLAFIVVPICFGYCLNFINYSGFSLENSYYIFSIIGVFATIIAVWAAIRIPAKIAYEQNKISLFKDRYELYNTYQKSVEHARNVTVTLSKNRDRFIEYDQKFSLYITVLDKLMPYKNIRKTFDTITDNNTNHEMEVKLKALISTSSLVNEFIIEVNKYKFLFDLNDIATKQIEDMLSLIKKIDNGVLDSKTTISEFIDLCQNLSNKIVNPELEKQMYTELSLNKG